MQLLKTDATNKDFQKLVELLDRELATIDGDDHTFYHQFNGIDQLKYVIIAYQDQKPVSCGAFKVLDKQTVEIKRMYTLKNYRGSGLASKVLAALEDWANNLSFTRCRLETGVRQPDAIRLYTKNNYQPIENYGQYLGIENSKCFEKIL
ncbi:MAG TPA: GNAT family N-acetyltransferase [Mesonia sp.]|nr:GNAT family N-acetyltransferase [Mesonia sp.]HIO27953.1 GNAT family N-acetyltransferase [Flavobacteriaceae bacterium]